MRIKSLVWMMLAGSVFGWNHHGDAADLPTYEEISAIYQQKLSALLPLTVEWIHVEQELAASVETDELQLNLVKTSLARSDYPTSDKSFIKEMDTNLSRGLSSDARELRLSPRRSRHFLWTDGTRIQYRVPEGQKDLPLDGTEITSGESLIGNWVSVRITSYVPDREPKMRVWLGLGGDGKTPHGIIASRELGQLRGRLQVPPIGGERPDWAEKSKFCHLDMWCGVNLSEGLQSSVDGGVVGGEESILIRHARGGTKGTSVARVAIWVARRKGLLPLRIESSYSGGPLSLEPTDEFPSRTYETLEVDGIEPCGSGFYPRKIKTTTFGPDPKWRAKNIGKDPTAVPREVVQMVPMKTIEQEILHVDSGKSLPQESLALNFPVGTRFQDQDTKQWFLEGTPKEEFDRQLVAEINAVQQKHAPPPSAIPPRRGPLSVFLWVNLAVVVLLAVIYLRFRGQSKP